MEFIRIKDRKTRGAAKASIWGIAGNNYVVTKPSKIHFNHFDFIIMALESDYLKIISHHCGISENGFVSLMTVSCKKLVSAIPLTVVSLSNLKAILGAGN